MKGVPAICGGGVSVLIAAIYQALNPPELIVRNSLLIATAIATIGFILAGIGSYLGHRSLGACGHAPALTGVFIMLLVVFG